MPDSLSLLEAVTLLRQRKPDEVSAEELAGLRTCFQSNPALAGMVGGAGVVERYIAEAEAAIQRKEESTALAETVAPGQPVAAAPRNHRRIVELSVYVVLLLAGAYGIYFLLVKDTRPPVVNGPAASESATQATAANGAHAGAGNKSGETTQPATQKTGDSAAKPGAASAEPGEPAAPPDDPNAWRGWRMSSAPDVKTEKKTEWDRTDPSNPEPADALSVRGGQLMLSRDTSVEPDTRWLMIHVRPNSVAMQPGQIVVSMDGKEIAQASIGAGQTDWPLYVPVTESQGVKRHFAVTFKPANPKQEVTFWNLQLLASQVRKAQPESPLIAALRSPDAAVRLQGATAAGNVTDLFVVHTLVATLKDTQRDVRRAAAASLAKYTHDDCYRYVAESLTTALQDADQDVRKTAATSLMAFSTRVNPAGAAALAGALSDRDPQVRQTAASAIMSFKGETTWDVLRKAMLQHPDYDLRLQIVQQLSGQKDPKTVAAISELLGSPDDRLRLAAVAALGPVQDPATAARLIQLLADPEPGVRRSVAQILCQINSPAAEAALRGAVMSHPDALVRRTALTYLRSRATSADLPAIREVLRSPDVPLRRLAPAALLSIDEGGSHALLAQLLDDADQHVRSQAAETLIRKRGDQADEILLKALSSHPDLAVRNIAMTRFYTLSQITPKAIGPLRELTKNPSSVVRSNALVALENIRRGVVERVKLQQAETARKDPHSPLIREEIQKALAQSPGPEILAAITPLLDDPNAVVWEGAANAFANDPSLAATPIIFGVMAKSQNVVFRRRAAVHFANSEWIVPTANDREPLLALLKDADPETRRWALKSLSRLPSPETKALLEQHLEDPSFMVREIAAVALGKNPAIVSDDTLLPADAKLGGPQAVPALAGLLQSPRGSVRQAAATRLADIVDPAAEDVMLQALASHADVGVRRTAAARFAKQQQPTPKVVGPARAALAIPDVQLRADTLLALSKTPNHPDVFAMVAPLAQDADMNVRLAAATVLAQNLNPAAEDVAIKLIQSSANPPTLQQAIARLGLLLSARGIEVLKPLLHHGEVEVRIAALNAINRLKDRSVVPIVATALSDPDTQVRQHAATLLTGRTEPAINDILLTALSSHADPAVRRVAVAWCHHRPRPQIVGPLSSCIHHSDDMLRLAVLQALAANPAATATAGIIELVSDPVYEVRMAAATTLAARRDAAAESAALSLLATGDIEIRRLMAARFQAAASPQAGAALIGALKDPDDQLRYLAAMSLRNIPTAEATEALALALTDLSPSVRKVAIAALSQRQDPRSQAAVKEYQAKLTAGN